MVEDPVPNGMVELKTEVEFQMPVLLGYTTLEEPVPIGAVGPAVRVVFQIPELLICDGRDAEAEAIEVADSLDEVRTTVEEAAVEDAVDSMDDELDDEDVTGGFAQSLSSS